MREFAAEQWFAESPDQLFGFFADPANLDAITPSWLRFRTVTRGPVLMCRGAIIDYKLRVYGFPMRWRTEIKIWDPPVRFVDEQVRGPYRLWIHKHSFERRDGGTLMRDHVRYAVPFDLLLYHWVVRRDVQRIFAFRREMLRQRFRKTCRART